MLEKVKKKILQLLWKHLCAKGDGYYYRMWQKLSKGKLSFFLDLIILIAIARLANIHNKKTWFLCKKQFFSKLNIRESCMIFSWHGRWRLVLYTNAVTTGWNQTRLLWWTMLKNPNGMVLKIKWTYRNGRSYWIEEVILKCQSLH